ncbi:MAG: hypothetical protein ABIO40_11385 [Devosia sp.]
MLRSGLIVLALALATPAFAAEGVCESPEFIQFIKETLPKMEYADGTRMTKYLTKDSVVKATTVKAVKGHTRCRVTIRIIDAGVPQNLKGMFDYRETPAGNSAHWDPTY